MSQGTYTITEARQGRTYTGKHGDLVVWLVKLDNAQAETPSGEFELHKKPGNTPNPGDAIEVKTFSPGEHDGTPYVRIFVESQSSTGQSSQGGSQSGGRQSSGPGLTWRSAPYERGAEHPRNEVRMIHTSALSAAVPYIEQMLTLKLLPQPATEQEYWALVSQVAKKLTASYQAPLGRVSGPPPAQSNGGEVPADTTGLGDLDAPSVQRELGVRAPVAAGRSDDDIPF